MIDIKNEAHQMDLSMMKKITNTTWFNNIIHSINDNSLDNICDRLIDCSYPKIPDYSNLYAYLDKGMDLFGVHNVRSLLLTRDYSYEVSCHGFSNPVLVVPEILLERKDESIIEARILAGVASIAMEHHKLEFLIWLAENTLTSMPIPFASPAIRGFLYEWYRSRKYTLDRAVFLATGNKDLTLRNILYGEIPFDILEKMELGTNVDAFMRQVNELNELSGVKGYVSKFLGAFQAYDWLPIRYQEILNYIVKRRD